MSFLCLLMHSQNEKRIFCVYLSTLWINWVIKQRFWTHLKMDLRCTIPVILMVIQKEICQTTLVYPFSSQISKLIVKAVVNKIVRGIKFSIKGLYKDCNWIPWYILFKHSFSLFNTISTGFSLHTILFYSYNRLKGVP